MSSNGKPGLVKRIAREIIREHGYSITHLEGGGVHSLYIISKEVVLKKMKGLCYQTLGRIAGSHTANHADIHRSDKSLLEVHCNEDSPYDADESGRCQLQRLAAMVIVAEMADIITEDYVNDRADTIRINLDSH